MKQKQQDPSHQENLAIRQRAREGTVHLLTAGSGARPVTVDTGRSGGGFHGKNKT